MRAFESCSKDHRALRARKVPSGRLARPGRRDQSGQPVNQGRVDQRGQLDQEDPKGPKDLREHQEVRAE